MSSGPRPKTRPERQVLDDVLLKLTFPSLETDFLNFIEGGIMSYTRTGSRRSDALTH